MSALVVKSLYKVFGSGADKAVRRLKEGATRNDAVAGLRATAAVIDANFEVKRGEIFVVMGLSGSGKSTLIRMLNGLLAPSHGSVEIDGIDLTKLKPAALRRLRREKISMVFQHFALLPHRTVLDNAGYALEAAGLPRPERRTKALEALRMVGLEGWEDKLPHQLSGGMRQRVGLARALASGTDIMLMDEAFSALDPLIRREVQDQLLELQADLGKTIVFITHDLNEAMRLGDRIAVMRDGRIVQIGTAEEILTDPANDYVAQFVADVDRTRILTAQSVMERPLSVVDVTAGPRLASRILRENQTSVVYVTDRNKRFLGTASDDVITQAVREGRQTLDGLASTAHVRSAPADRPVAELFAACAESPHPLAVVNPGGRLLGVIPRVTLLSALGSIGTTDDRQPQTAASPDDPQAAAGSGDPQRTPGPDDPQAAAGPDSSAVADADPGGTSGAGQATDAQVPKQATTGEAQVREGEPA